MVSGTEISLILGSLSTLVAAVGGVLSTLKNRKLTTQRLDQQDSKLEQIHQDVTTTAPKE